jgi:hypothetical protein
MLFGGRGATCYLNSLIQALYMTPELRAGLFDLSLDDLQVVTTAPPPPVAATAPESDDAAAATTEQDPDKREEPAPSGEDHQAKTEHATAPAVEPATTATQLTTVCHRTRTTTAPHTTAHARVT